MERIPRPGDLYRDEDDVLYQLAAIAEHAQTGEKLVIYQSLHKDYRVYAMPEAMFMREMKPEGVNRTEEESGQLLNEEESASQNDPAEKELEPEELQKEAAALNPLLLDFVEEEDYGKRLDIFRKMKGNLTQEELDILYEVLDLFRKTGDIEQQAESVESYLKMQKKFDGTRLR